LLDDAKERVPRLKWDLSEVGLRNFLVDEENVGIACTKYRTAISNGWSFAPLLELREAWCRKYGQRSGIMRRRRSGAGRRPQRRRSRNRRSRAEEWEWRVVWRVEGMDPTKLSTLWGKQPKMIPLHTFHTLHTLHSIENDIILLY
jgi:hypothetical protein